MIVDERMSNKLITLQEWASSTFEQPPSVYTLRRWVKDGKIYPAPKKIGRTYYVQPGAQYVDDYNSTSFLEAVRGSTATQ